MMEPPEPFVRTMEGLDELKDGEKMLLLLYRLLQKKCDIYRRLSQETRKGSYLNNL